MTIESQAYQQYFGAQLQATERWLVDTCRALLTQQFGFVRWAPPGTPSADTVVMRWFESVARPRNVYLEIRLRGTRSGTVSPLVTMFETFSQYDRRDEWTPEAVRGGWGHAIDSILSRSAPSIVADLLGAVPLAAPVILYPQDLLADVQLTPQSIHAADHPRPSFRVEVTMEDPGLPLPTRDEVQFLLGACRPHRSAGTYVCDMQWLRYPDTTVLAEDRQPLILRSLMQPHSLHVRAYTSMGPDAPFGAIPP